jgi:hypothetical protein
MTMSAEEKALLKDHERAENVIDKFKATITYAFMARNAILTGAIQDFNSFRDLPPKSDLASAIWDTAFGIVSAAVPALKIGEFLKKHYERADVALKAAEAFGQKARRADKAIKVVSKTAEHGGTTAKYANDVKGILEKVKAVEKYKGETEEHASWGPIKSLVNDLHEAPKLWWKVVDLEATEWENRLDGLKTENKGSLVDFVRHHLPDPPPLDDDEVRLMYLFEMIFAHCQKEVYWEIQPLGGARERRTLKGINGNQMDQIVDWFGAGTKRGPHFKRPFIFDISWFLALWPVREKRLPFREPFSRR